MKKLLLALAILALPSTALAQAMGRNQVSFGPGTASWSAACGSDPHCLNGFWNNTNGFMFFQSIAGLNFLINVWPNTPQAYGAKADGVQDDTSALQSCANALGLGGGDCIIPNGTYKITSTISVPQIVGARIFGQSRAGTIISQATSNTPIFTFTTCDTHQFDVSSMTLTYATPQTSSNTSSIELYFSCTSGTPGDGFYNFTIRDITFNNGFRAIGNNHTTSPTMWGDLVEDCVFNSSMTGAAYDANNVVAGQPNVTLRHLYIRADSATENLIQLTSVAVALLDSIEFNFGTIGGAGRPGTLIAVSASNGIVMNNVRSEALTIASSFNAPFNFSQSNVTINGLQISTNINASVTGWGISSNTGSVTTINNATFNVGTVGGGGAFYALAGSYGAITNYGWTPGATAGTALLYNSPTPTWTFNDQTSQPQGGTDNGDATVTLTATSAPLQTFNTTLTANRTVNLPTSGLYTGMVFTIARTASTPGAFTLTVNDGLSGRNVVIPANSQGYVTYMARGGAQWIPVASSMMSVNGGNGATLAGTIDTSGNQTFFGINGYSVGNSIASATTIAPTTTLTHVTGTTTIQTITAPATCATSGRGCCITLIPDGLWATNTSGNIALASTAVVSKALTECYDNATSKWYPNY